MLTQTLEEKSTEAAKTKAEKTKEKRTKEDNRAGNRARSLADDGKAATERGGATLSSTTRHINKTHLKETLTLKSKTARSTAEMAKGMARGLSPAEQSAKSIQEITDPTNLDLSLKQVREMQDQLVALKEQQTRDLKEAQIKQQEIQQDRSAKTYDHLKSGNILGALGQAASNMVKNAQDAKSINAAKEAVSQTGQSTEAAVSAEKMIQDRMSVSR